MPIFDQGYQHWSGKLSGHTWRWLAISRQGIRAALKKRWMRQVTFLAWVPALMLAAILCGWGLLERKSSSVTVFLQYLTFVDPRVRADPKHYRDVIWTLSFSYFLASELRFAMFMMIGAVASLISLDLRFNALPLYFSRPIRKIDYFLGKLGIIGGLLGMIMILPAVLAYILGLLFSLDWTILSDTFHLLLGAVAYGVIITLSAGTLLLALSAMSRNSRYVALLWVGIWIMSGIIGTVMEGVDRDQRRNAYVRAEMEQDQLDVQSIRQRGATPQEWQARRHAVMEARNDFDAAELESAKKDWRPMVSYTGNLTRVGEELLGTRAAWQTLADLDPPDSQSRFMMDFAGPQYPWKWSAIVLAGLFVISTCTMNIPVKSLDRLK